MNTHTQAFQLACNLPLMTPLHGQRLALQLPARGMVAIKLVATLRSDHSHVERPPLLSKAWIEAPRWLSHKPTGVQAERVEGPGGEARWRLSDVIGAEEGLGVECLSGSGAIASAYNRAFAEVCAAAAAPPLCAPLCCRTPFAQRLTDEGLGNL